MSLGESESSRKVLGKVGDSSDSGDDGLVDGFLVGSFLGGESLLLLLSILEELSLSSRALGGLLLGEVSVVELGVELEMRNRGITKVSFTILPRGTFLNSSSVHSRPDLWTSCRKKL